MVSNHIQSLEDRLGAGFFNRTTRKVSLTEIGKAYYDRCVRFSSTSTRPTALRMPMHSTPRGTLRIYTSTHIVQFVRRSSRNSSPPIPMSSRSHHGRARIDLIDEGFDLAIRLSRRLTQPDRASLATWRHVLCCSHGYLEKHGRPQALSELTERSCACHVNYPYDEWRFVDRKGVPASVRVAGNLMTNSGETLRMTALQGVAFLAPPVF